MKNDIKKGKSANKKSDVDETDKLPPYPKNPPSEDIYRNSVEEQDIDPEDITKRKSRNETEKIVNVGDDDLDAEAPAENAIRKKKVGKRNEKDFTDDVSGGDLDIAGSDMDGNKRINGDEDEENDYYSLGGDDHLDLDEDRGE